MASSLEKLLAEEGFKRKGLITKSRPSFRAESVPHHRLQEQGRRSPFVSGDKVKTQRAKSDVTRHNPVGEHYNTTVANRYERSRDHFVRMMKSSRESKNEKVEMFLDGDETYVEGKGFSVHTSSQDMKRNHEIIEVDEEEDNGFEEVINWNRVHNTQRGKDNYPDEDEEKLKLHEHRSAKIYKKLANGSYMQYKPGHSSSQTNQWNSTMEKTDQRSEDRPYTGSMKSKNIEEIHFPVHGHTADAVSELALDKVAVQAMISILNEYIKRFLKDEDFRITLRDNCFSSLNFFEIQEGDSNETKIIMSLEKAIETVERAIEDSVNPKDLKKASLQLNVITGLSLNDLRNEFTCGIPNYKLSACAHLYLSVIYTLQKKERVSAKHLLQVFCESPFQARTTLLTELWDNVFFPHLQDLKTWYTEAADSRADAPKEARELKQITKLYNEILDSGTYKFATYYKDWLTEGTEAPSVPRIEIPSRLLGEGYHQDSPRHYLAITSSDGSFSPQPMVSKKLYDDVFNVSRDNRDNSYEY